jgi:hypothetical protein
MSTSGRGATVGYAMIKTAWQERIVKNAKAEQNRQHYNRQCEARLRAAHLPFGKRTHQAKMTVDRPVTMQCLVQNVTDGKSGSDQ